MKSLFFDSLALCLMGAALWFLTGLLQAGPPQVQQPPQAPPVDPFVDGCPCPAGGPCSCPECRGGGCNCGKGCPCVLTYQAGLGRARKERLAFVIWHGQEARTVKGAVSVAGKGKNPRVLVYAYQDGKLQLCKTLTGRPTARAVRACLVPRPVAKVPARAVGVRCIGGA